MSSSPLQSSYIVMGTLLPNTSNSQLNTNILLYVYIKFKKVDKHHFQVF